MSDETAVYGILEDVKDLTQKIRDYEGEADQKLVINWVYDTLKLVEKLGKAMKQVVVFPFVPVTPTVKMDLCLLKTSESNFFWDMISSAILRFQRPGLMTTASDEWILSRLWCPRSMSRSLKSISLV